MLDFMPNFHRNCADVGYLLPLNCLQLFIPLPFVSQFYQPFEMFRIKPNVVQLSLIVTFGVFSSVRNGIVHYSCFSAVKSSPNLLLFGVAYQLLLYQSLSSTLKFLFGDSCRSRFPFTDCYSAAQSETFCTLGCLLLPVFVA